MKTYFDYLRDLEERKVITTDEMLTLWQRSYIETVADDHNKN